MSRADPDGTKKTRGAPPWPKGVSGNPGGRPKTKELEQYAREHGPAAIDRLMKIGLGRGVAAVRAVELVLAYGFGRPKHQLAITSTGGGGTGGAPAFAGAARALLEAAIKRAEGSATVLQTVTDGQGATENPNNGEVIDVTAEPVPAERGQSVAERTGEGGAP